MANTDQKVETGDLFDDAIPRRKRRSSPIPEPRRFVLPNDLTAALKQLGDKQLNTLLEAAMTESRRRQKHVAEKQKKPKSSPKPVPQGQVNLIRAAFKAGVKPTAIARQLRLSPSIVQRVLKDMPTR